MEKEKHSNKFQRRRTETYFGHAADCGSCLMLMGLMINDRSPVWFRQSQFHPTSSILNQKRLIIEKNFVLKVDRI